MTTKHEWLSPEEFVEFAPEEPGTVNVYHCKLGRNNDRLYVTRKEDGDIIAYCHHCTKRGYYSVASERKVRSRKKAALSLPITCGTSVHAEPKHGELEEDGGRIAGRGTTKEIFSGSIERAPFIPFSDWTTAAKKWWLEYGLTIKEAEDYAVVFEPDSGSLQLPIYCRGKLCGMQSRHFGIGSRKYITMGTTISDPICSSSGDSSKLTIVEDIRSAIKVGRVTAALPLLGTNLRDEHIATIRKFSKVFIFLDNDNIEVVRAAREMCRRLTPFVECEIIRETVDPKELSIDRLKELLK